jgi:diguanylate cyclase (GGDEF)-like protein
MVQQLRSVDLCGRIGGEEFVILLPDTDLANTRHIAERIRAAIAAHSIVAHSIAGPATPIHITVSIGITMLQGDDASLDATLARADQALYAAKAAGRNRVTATAAHTLDRAGGLPS